MSVHDESVAIGLPSNGAGVKAEIETWASTAMMRLWTDIVAYRWPLLWVFLLELLARLQSFSATMYSIDGYNPGSYELDLRDGRWGTSVLEWVRSQLGYTGINVVPSSLVLATILYAGAGFLFARFIFRKPSWAELFIFVSLYTLHPFNTEVYTFSDITLFLAIATFSAAAGLVCCGARERSWLAFSLGIFLMLFALSINQLLLTDIVVIALLALVVRMTRDEPIVAHLPRASLMSLTPPIRALIAVLTSVVLYVLSLIIAAGLLNIGLARADQRQIINLDQKLSALQHALGMVFLPFPGFITPAMSYVLIGILIVSIAAICSAIMARRHSFVVALAALPLLGIAAVCSVIVPVAAKQIWLVPRLLAPCSLFFAGMVMIGWRYTLQPWMRRIEALGIVALIIGYIGTSNSILYDQHRVNFWDMQEANRIVQRLEINPNYGNMHELAILNAFWAYSVPLPTTYGDLNISALYPAWSKLGVIEEATGLRFQDPSAANMRVASKFCGKAGVWPSIASTTIIGDLGIVCLGPNRP